MSLPNTEEEIEDFIDQFEQELKKLPGGLGSPLVRSERALCKTLVKFLVYQTYAQDNTPPQ